MSNKSLNNWTKKELIEYISDLNEQNEKFRNLHKDQKNQLADCRHKINELKCEVHEAEKYARKAEKIHTMEVASTLRTARFLIDSFSFDAFTHREKNNLAHRYSEMLKAKELAIFEEQIRSGDEIPF